MFACKIKPVFLLFLLFKGRMRMYVLFLKDIELAKKFAMRTNTDYGRPERKQPSLPGRKFNPNPKFLGMAAAYFVCHISPIFQKSLKFAFAGCPQSVVGIINSLQCNLIGDLLSYVKSIGRTGSNRNCERKEESKQQRYV